MINNTQDVEQGLQDADYRLLTRSACKTPLASLAAGERSINTCGVVVFSNSSAQVTAARGDKKMMLSLADPTMPFRSNSPHDWQSKRRLWVFARQSDPLPSVQLFDILFIYNCCVKNSETSGVLQVSAPSEKLCYVIVGRARGPSSEFGEVRSFNRRGSAPTLTDSDWRVARHLLKWFDCDLQRRALDRPDAQPAAVSVAPPPAPCATVWDLLNENDRQRFAEESAGSGPSIASRVGENDGNIVRPVERAAKPQSNGQVLSATVIAVESDVELRKDSTRNDKAPGNPPSSVDQEYRKLAVAAGKPPLDSLMPPQWGVDVCGVVVASSAPASGAGQSSHTVLTLVDPTIPDWNRRLLYVFAQQQCDLPSVKLYDVIFANRCYLNQLALPHGPLQIITHPEMLQYVVVGRGSPDPEVSAFDAKGTLPLLTESEMHLARFMLDWSDPEGQNAQQSRMLAKELEVDSNFWLRNIAETGGAEENCESEEAEMQENNDDDDEDDQPITWIRHKGPFYDERRVQLLSARMIDIDTNRRPPIFNVQLRCHDVLESTSTHPIDFDVSLDADAIAHFLGALVDYEDDGDTASLYRFQTRLHRLADYCVERQVAFDIVVADESGHLQAPSYPLATDRTGSLSKSVNAESFSAFCTERPSFNASQN